MIAFDNYIIHMLKPNEKKQVVVAYSDSPDAVHWKKYILLLFESEYKRTDSGIPEWFNVIYDDIDGNRMFQSFDLEDYEGTKYYSLHDIYEVRYNC